MEKKEEEKTEDLKVSKAAKIRRYDFVTKIVF